MAKKLSKKRGKGKSKEKKVKKKKIPLTKREIEIAKKKAEFEEQERLRTEAIEAAKVAKILSDENTKRASHLKESGVIINAYEKVVYAHMKQQQRLHEWETYIACRDTPEVSSLVEVNSYMTEWTLLLTKPTIELIFSHTLGILTVIEELKHLLELPPENIRVENLNGLGLMYHEFEEKQQEYLDDATYHIIEDLTELYDPEIGVFESIKATPNKNIIHGLWGNLFTTPENDRHEYTSQGFKFQIPESLIMTKGIYRLLKTVYDHYSDTCNSYYPPAVESYLKKSIDNWILKKLEGCKTHGVLKSPEDLNSQVDEDKDGVTKKKKKKGKKGKSKKGKKKKGKRGKSRSSGVTTDTDGEETDEDYKKLVEQLDDDQKKVRSERKKLETKLGGKKKGKKGKKGKKLKGSVATAEQSTDNNETTGTDGEYEEENDEEEEETEQDEKSKKKKGKDMKKDEEPVAKVETKEERKARRRREEEEKEKEDENFNFNFPTSGKGGDKTYLEDDVDGVGSNVSLHAKKKVADNESDEEKKKKEEAEGKSKEKKVKKRKAKEEASEEPEETEIPKNKSKSKKRGTSKRKGKKGKRSKSRNKKKGKKSRSRSKGKKGKKKGGKSKSKSKSRSKSRGRSKEKKGRGKSKGKSKSKGRKSKSRSRSKSRGRSNSKKGKSKSKSRSASSKKSKGSKGSGKGNKGKKGSKSKNRSKSKKKGKSKSKSKSRSRSKGKKKGKRSKGRSRSKKGKKRKKSKSRSKSKDRARSEAELAKERERLEKKPFIPQLQKSELNLRKYGVQGGIFNFTMLQVPPQSKERGDWTSRIIEADRTIKEVPFEMEYEAPELPDIEKEYKNSPEGMEDAVKAEEKQRLVQLDLGLPDMILPEQQELETAELAERKNKLQVKLMEQYEEEKEKRFNKLITISLQVPNTVLWFEQPIPVRWDVDSRIWTTDGFYEVKFNNETLEMQFRTNRFGILALAHNRWSNYPYESWEFKPLELNNGKFTLNTPKIKLEFLINKDLICLNSMSNMPNSKLVQEELLNVYMRPNLLIKLLRSHGLDVFPEFDSYAYIDGLLVKQIDLESHIYQCIAVIGPAFVVSWSKWNLKVGRDKIVFQIKDKGGSSDSLMIYNDARTCYITACTETSTLFSTERVGEAEYSADLIQLITNTGNSETKENIKSASAPYVETIRQLISSVRPLSFC